MNTKPTHRAPTLADGLVPRKGSGGRPTIEASAAMSDTILNITWTLFLTGGYHKLSVDAIAREGSISKRTIYDRFGSKVGLLVAAFERGARDWASELAAELADHRGGGRLRDFVMRMVEMLSSIEVITMSGFIAIEGRAFPQVVETHQRVLQERLGDLAESMTSVIPNYPEGEAGVLLARSLVALLDGWARSLVSFDQTADPVLSERIYSEARAILVLHGCDLSRIL